MKKLIAMVLSYSYGVICKHCGQTVIEPDKTRKQKYLMDRCPNCQHKGTDPVAEVKEKPNAQQ